MQPSADPTSDRNWAVAAHLSVLGNTLPVPFAGLIASIVIFNATRDRGFAHDHAREALNLQLTLVLVGAALMVAGFVSMASVTRDTAEVWAVSYGFALFVAWIAAFCAGIAGAARAGRGHMVRYPFVVRFLREPEVYR
jgi:uncharacterized Tic20 family protein